jgi:hypothetical protein
VLAERAAAGAALFVRSAEFGGGGLRLEFDSETTLNDGSVVVRRGIGRVVFGASTDVSVVLTAPREGWAEVEGPCRAVVESLVVRGDGA